jgi:AcrR family transcriptional regulator
MATTARTESARRNREARHPKAPVREKGQRTRRRILEAAAYVFTREGYLNARVADIAQRAKVAHGSFYTYFDSKEDVFRSLAQDVHEQMRAAIADAEEEGVELANARYIEAYERHAPILGLIEQVATFDEHFRELRADLRARYFGLIERAVVLSYERGETRSPPLDPRTVASALGAMVEHFAYRWFVLEEPHDRKAATDTLNTVCRRALGLDGRA